MLLLICNLKLLRCINRAGVFGLPCRFWLAVQDLKKRPIREVPARVQEIWQEFLAPGAPSAINVDSKSYDKTTQNVKDPGRYAFEDAQVQITWQKHSMLECCLRQGGRIQSSCFSQITFLTTGTHLQVDEEWLLQPVHTLQCLPGVITGQKEGKSSALTQMF